MSVTSQEIKELRQETGISVMECKKALEEAGGDKEKAWKILQEKSKEVQRKKQDRTLGAGVVQSYIHNNGNVGVLLELDAETDFVANNEEFKKLAYEIAMHIAAMNPQYLKQEDVSDEERQRMKERFEEEFADKPEQAREKAVEGKLKTFFAERTLLEQGYVKDPDKTIANLIEDATQKFKERIEIVRFTRYEVGTE